MFKLCFHKYETEEINKTKFLTFGKEKLPGYRAKKVCNKCGKVKYLKLTFSMPDKLLYEEELWEKPKYG